MLTITGSQCEARTISHKQVNPRSHCRYIVLFPTTCRTRKSLILVDESVIRKRISPSVIPLLKGRQRGEITQPKPSELRSEKPAVPIARHQKHSMRRSDCSFDRVFNELAKLVHRGRVALIPKLQQHTVDITAIDITTAVDTTATIDIIAIIDVAAAVNRTTAVNNRGHSSALTSLGYLERLVIGAVIVLIVSVMPSRHARVVL